ncbi:hypothetical protein [Ignavibacterium sp.]|uniref:hypothetical protein n=1 Tax=Ignavibacterium sp. TaxID=2651167 RepID=UPI00307EAE12
MNLEYILYTTIVFIISIAVYGFYFIHKSKKENQLLLKRNISLLREEKIICAVEPNRKKKRRKLLRQFKSENKINETKVLSEAQKSKLSAGEILLAQRINSFSN